MVSFFPDMIARFSHLFSWQDEVGKGSTQDTVASGQYSVSNPAGFYTAIKQFNGKKLKYGVKALGQEERNVVINLIDRITVSKNKNCDFISEREKKLASRAIERISLSRQSLHIKSNFIMKIWKGFLNLIGARISSRTVLDRIEGRRLDQDGLEKVLEKIKILQKINPGKKVKLCNLLKELGYAPKLKNLDFAIEGLSVKCQTRIPFGKPPAWGTDIFKNIDFSALTFCNCQFEWVNFSGSEFHDVIFKKCNLRYSVNVKTAFVNCAFINSNLSMSCFEEAVLKKTTFLRSMVKYTSFYKAKIGETFFKKSSLIGAVFLDAEMTKDSKIRECNLRNCYFFDAKSSFKIFGGKPNIIRRPLIGILWNHHKTGIAGNKITHSIVRNGGVPFKIHFDQVVDKKGINKEVKEILEEITKEKQSKESIPYQIIQRAKERPGGDLKKLLVMAKGLSEKMGGLVLPGGDTDIPPEFYGATKVHSKTNPDSDYLRIVLEFALINESAVRGLPLLGICRGCQLVNIFYGGDLTQHVTWQDGVQIYTLENKKSVGIMPGILKKGAIRGFSNHHQANNKIADSLVLVAKRGAVPKILQNKHGSPVLLTQFHPEFSGDDSNFLGKVLDLILSSNNEEIFKAVIDCSKTHQATRDLKTKIFRSLAERQQI